MATDLTEFQRERLDAIIGQMESNNEPEQAIRSVVDDFKSKYGQAEGAASVGTPYQRFSHFLRSGLTDVLPRMTASPEMGGELIREPMSPEGKAAAVEALGTVIPPNELQLGMMLGTMGAGAGAGAVMAPAFRAAAAAGEAAPLWARMVPPAARVLGGAAGGEAGGQIQGAPTGRGALIGAAGNTAMELAGLGFLGAKTALQRWGPGALQRIGAFQTEQLGRAMEQVAPPIGAPRTGAEMYALGREGYGDAKKRLASYMENKTAEAEALLTPERGAAPKLNIPALPGGAVRPTPTGPMAGPQGELIAAPEAGGGLTLSEAAEALKQPGWMGYGGAKGVPAGRHLPGAEARIDYVGALNQIRSEIQRVAPSPQAATQAIEAFTEGRTVYSAGLAMLEPLKLRGVFVKRPNVNPMVNRNAYRDVFDQTIWPRLTKAAEDGRMPWEELAAVRSALYGSAPIGSRDILPSVSPGALGGMGSALQELGRAWGGSPRILTVLPRTLLPGLGAEYTGLPPVAGAGAVPQTLLDIFGQRRLEQMIGP